MKTIEEIELESMPIINRYKKDFNTQCETSEHIKNLLDEFMLLKKYQSNLEKELKYIVPKRFDKIKRNGNKELENIFRNSKRWINT